MNRQERAEFMAHMWTQHVYPDKGDVKMLSLALHDDDNQPGIGMSVFGDADVFDLCDALVTNLVDEERVAPSWLAFTATVFYDEMSEADLAGKTENLGVAPTPTTRHGLMVLMVDVKGACSTIWEVDLDEKIALPDTPIMQTDEDPTGDHFEVLRGLFSALVAIGGEA